MRNALLFFLLIAAAVEDVRFGKISNQWIAVGMVAGFTFQLFRYGSCGFIYFLWNVSVPVFLFVLLFLMRVFGAGDIKLFSMIGSMVTLHQLLRIIKTAIILGGFWALFRLIQKRRGSRIPFSVVIALGCMLVLFAAD